MQNNSPLALGKTKNLQARLTLVFSVLFVFSVLALSFFLFNILQLVSLNEQARTIFEQNRRLYQAETLARQYQIQLNLYLTNASPNAAMVFYALEYQLDDVLFQLESNPPVGDTDDYASLFERREAIGDIAFEIFEVIVNEEFEEPDWDAVADLGFEADEYFKQMYADLHLLRAEGADELAAVQTQAQTFGLFAGIIGVVALPAFVGLALLVALIIYFQIHLPMAQLERAAKELQTRQFDPASLEKLSRREDEIGAMAREFLEMAESVSARTVQLEQEAAEIRAKIR
jgi:methyl-accepting chemotaxis protein